MKDVVGCHGNNGGARGDSGERTTGASDVNVGVGQRRLRVDSVLRRHSNRSQQVLIQRAAEAQVLGFSNDLVEARGHDEEGRGGLMSSRCGGGREVVALQDVLVLRRALVELVVLPSDVGNLKHVTQHVSSCRNDGGAQFTKSCKHSTSRRNFHFTILI